MHIDHKGYTRKKCKIRSTGVGKESGETDDRQTDRQTDGRRHIANVNTRERELTKNAFVWLNIAAPSDLLLDVVRFTNVLTYLLTYLHTCHT